jgi:glycosyltransferase involved in cell wall biosynthesis
VRIAYVCHEYPPADHGGIGTVTQTMARALVARGYQVSVIGVCPPAWITTEVEEDQGVRVWRLPRRSHRLGWVGARHELFRRLSRWARRGEVELIEVPDWQGWAAGWPRLPVPVVARLHGSVTYFAGELGRRPPTSSFWLERASLRRADFWSPVSRYTARRTLEAFRLPSPRGAVLYNPVPAVPLSQADGRFPNRVVFAGTLTPRKGVVSLFKAWPTVLYQYPEAELHVYGRDARMGRVSGRWYLSALLRDGESGSVHFYGQVPHDQVLAAFGTARLAVLPSYAEAFALAPAEAMACGCPTVYSRRGAGTELIENGRDGILVDPDRPAEIADAIIRLLSNDALAANLGTAGSERIKKQFALDRLLPQHEAFYQRCLTEFGSRRRDTDNR